MTYNGTSDGWDLIVSPWHLDEHIPAWAVPAGATALRYPAGPGSALARISDCLVDVITAAKVIGACIACTRLPDRINDLTAQEAITRLGAALGAQLAWVTTPRT